MQIIGYYFLYINNLKIIMFRVVVFGAGGVGKSSIILRFIKNSFSEAYVPTIEDIYKQVFVFKIFFYI